MRYGLFALLLACVLLPASAISAEKLERYGFEEIPLVVPDGPAFPRLAMWHPSFETNTLEECARYDVAVGNFHVRMYGSKSGRTFYKALKEENPKIKLLTYFTNSVIRHSNIYLGTRQTNPYLKDWPAKWFLTEAGTTLDGDLDDKQTIIPVKDWMQTGPTLTNTAPKEWEIFRTGEDVLCDGEIMSIRLVNKGALTITVERGMNGTIAKAHKGGVRIAPIVRFWRGSYIMNCTTDCPKARLHGAGGDETWGDYSFRMSQREAADWFYFIGGEKDGFLFDLMADKITWTLRASTRCIDIDQDNVSDQLDDLDSKWFDGIVHITDLFHAKFPAKPIIRNNSRNRRYADYNGENFESWPHDEWANWDLEETRGKTKYWHRYFWGDNREERGGIVEFVMNSAQPPNYTMISTADLETDLDKKGMPELIDPGQADWYKPDYQKLRWGLTSALLSGTYFIYVIHTDGHGALGLLWFDEYDNGQEGRKEGRGYLGQPVSGILKLFTDGKQKEWGVWGREFDNGFVICNPLDYEVDTPLPPGKWQRLVGAQVPEVNSGLFEEGSVKIPAYDGLILRRVTADSAAAQPVAPPAKQPAEKPAEPEQKPPEAPPSTLPF
jgi:hypothetical protein